jgi:sigma-B regulation protein RsbU (phosphoserine phosphatase)
MQSPTDEPQTQAADTSRAEPHAPLKVLVVDDALDMRVYLRALLRKWGYEPVLACNGSDGLALISDGDIRLVLLDWMMEGMSGPEVCAELRGRDFGHYVYTIMLTGRTDNTDLVYGLDAGADDFVRKPFDAQVLRARLQVGIRILGLEDRLSDQNRHLKEQRDALNQAYQQIQSDLAAAARIQRDSLPTASEPMAPLSAAWIFLPATHVSGDSFNFVPLSETLAGFYLLDVSGHGIPAALMSTGVSHSLVPLSGTVGMPEDYLDPAQLLAKLNRDLCRPDGELTNYATMVYGVIDRVTGIGRISIAGHPPPMILRQDGCIDTLETGGLPVGMFDVAAYEAQPFHLDPGDRILMYSDGVTECFDSQGRAFELERFQQVLHNEVSNDAAGLLAAVESTLRSWRGNAALDDDISVFVIERPATQ